MASPAHLDEWTGRDVTVPQIERELARLRCMSEENGSNLRTSVLTHLAWASEEWIGRARETLAGLAERHPSRTILLVPQPDAQEDGLDADVALQCFAAGGGSGHVCSEVIELRLRGRRALAPATIVVPLLISDLPAFLRWRGQPWFERPQFRQLVRSVDRLVVDSLEWDELEPAYERLTGFFDEVAVSDIAWARTLDWRRSLAELWPGIAEARQLRVAGPRCDALLLAGWLRARLDRDFELVHDAAEELEFVAVDGEPVPKPGAPQLSASDLLSGELDRFSRDRIYEEAVRAAAE